MRRALTPPFWDWGLGPMELGKIAAFCLELGKNNKTYFVIHILVFFNMFKCACIFIHTMLLEIHVWFHVLFYSNLYFFLHYFHFFFSRSQIGKTWGLNWEKKILFCIGNGSEYRPQIRQIESPDAWLPRKCNYQESVTTGQTDRQTYRQTPDKVIPMCRYASQATQKLKKFTTSQWCFEKSLVLYEVHSKKWSCPNIYWTLLYLDGATPTKFGPRPFVSPLNPSCFTIALQKKEWTWIKNIISKCYMAKNILKCNITQLVLDIFWAIFLHICINLQVLETVGSISLDFLILEAISTQISMLTNFFEIHFKICIKFTTRNHWRLKTVWLDCKANFKTSTV